MQYYISIIILSLSCLLTGCSHQQSYYYSLNPVPSLVKAIPTKSGLKISLAEVKVPAYLDKPQLSFYTNAHQSVLIEHHEWAERLPANIQRVIKTNLSTFLPQVLIQSSPWNHSFLPDYHLQVEITQLTVDINGESILQAEYILYQHNQPIKKFNGRYEQKITKTDPLSIVVSMNNLITQLTHDIAAKINLLKHPALS